MIRDGTTVCLDLETHSYDVCSGSYTIELSDGECSCAQNIQENLTAYVNKLKWEIAGKNKDKEKLFDDYENLQEKYNNLLLSYESLKISSSKQLTDLKRQLSSIKSEMDRNMNCVYEELEIKALQLNKMKQKLEKLRNANHMANEHIRTLQLNFDLERNRWKEEKIRLCSNKYSIKKMKELEELMLLHKQYENMRFDIPETRENSVYTSGTSINAIHEDIMTNNSFDNFFSNKTLAAELSLCSDIDQGSNMQIPQLLDFFDKNNSRPLSNVILNSENHENTIMTIPNECITKYASKNDINLQTDIVAFLGECKEVPGDDVSSSIPPAQEITVSEKSTPINAVQKNTFDSLKSENLNSLKFKKSRLIFLSRQFFSIYPPLPIPIRKTSLVFKKASALSCRMANITLKIPENKDSCSNYFHALHIISNIPSLMIDDVSNSGRKLNFIFNKDYEYLKT
ncbi:unnamed protein product [Pneumocystis jirovecii]|uniref:Uncharacterized protein n=1 Tax=Pneumocystis jirovecii TaxID=42068 RepID=L0PC27_PNEJI|nr:unnamed protein product [Pneumocystis jirovecii]